MSYGVASALQTAVYQQLINDPGLGALVGTSIFDALPSGTLPPLYIVIGAEEVRDASDKTGGGALHEFTVTIEYFFAINHANLPEIVCSGFKLLA